MGGTNTSLARTTGEISTADCAAAQTQAMNAVAEMVRALQAGVRAAAERGFQTEAKELMTTKRAFTAVQTMTQELFNRSGCHVHLAKNHRAKRPTTVAKLEVNTDGDKMSAWNSCRAEDDPGTHQSRRSGRLGSSRAGCHLGKNSFYQTPS